MTAGSPIVSMSDRGGAMSVHATGVGAPFSDRTVTSASPVPTEVNADSMSYTSDFGYVLTVLAMPAWSSGVNTRRACWTRAPSCESTSDGMSVGCCEQKNTPTPLERMSLTVCTTWSRNALDAPVNSRCASSKMNTSSGLSTSPFSGSSWNSSARIHMRKVENRAGREAWSPSSTAVTTPRPSRVRMRSAGSRAGSPKNVSPPCDSRVTRARRITPAVAEETPPMPLRSSLPSSLVRCEMTARRSLRSNSSSPCWSAQ